MHKILFTKTAEREYKFLYKTNKKIFKRIRKAINFLSHTPAAGKPLKLTLKGKWSYRVGSYRIIYYVEHKILIIYILDIGHHRQVYR